MCDWRQYPPLGDLDDWDNYDGEERADHPWTDEMVEKIKGLKSTEQIKTLELTDTWEDDHELCVGVIINGDIQFGAWWIVPEFFADLVYAGKGNEEAKKEVIDYVVGYVERDRNW